MAALLFALIALSALYWFPMRRWFVRWGATAADLARAMPGDPAALNPSYSATLAITIGARPESIWPWLVQMGYQRGGLYSYDWLDRLFGYLDRRSADSILPECQHLAVGDEIPMGRGQGFPVTAIEPCRALVLSGAGDGFAWVWEFGLYPIDERRTRLVSRNLVRVQRTLGSWLFMRVIEPAAFLMTRRMLLGLKRRAETLAATRGDGTPRRALEGASLCGPGSEVDPRDADVYVGNLPRSDNLYLIRLASNRSRAGVYAGKTATAAQATCGAAFAADRVGDYGHWPLG